MSIPRINVLLQRNSCTKTKHKNEEKTKQDRLQILFLWRLGVPRGGNRHTYIYGFSSFSKSEKTEYVYIDEDDNIDSVYHKLAPIARAIPMQAFRTLTHHSEYAEHIRTGRYAIHPGDGSLKTWRHLKNGLQEPVNLTVPSSGHSTNSQLSWDAS